MKQLARSAVRMFLSPFCSAVAVLVALAVFAASTMLPSRCDARATTRSWGSSAAVGSSAGDNNGWSNPNNAQSCIGDSSDERAIDSNSGSGGGTGCRHTARDQHDFYHWGFDTESFPSTAVLEGIVVSGQTQVDHTNQAPKLNFDIGIVRSGNTSWSSCKTHTYTVQDVDQSFSLGSTNDKWGFSPGPSIAEVSDNTTNFKLRTTTEASTNGRDFQLDCVGMTVHWSIPDLYWKHNAAAAAARWAMSTAGSLRAAAANPAGCRIPTPIAISMPTLSAAAGRRSM